MGLKNGAGNGAKGKGKRERSISADSFEQRETGTPNDDPEIKGMFARICVQAQTISLSPLSDGESLCKCSVKYLFVWGSGVPANEV